MASVVLKYVHAVRTFGWRDALIKMYTVGDIKFGDLMGEDAHGNKYYENKQYPFGQHRWVEYANIHNYDSSSVTAAWHPWLHHMSDHVPKGEQQLPAMEHIKIAGGEHTPYDTFVAPGREDSVNLSTWRPRGAGVGNVFQEAGEPAKFYKQPGHAANPASHKGGRFRKQKGMETWDPSDPAGMKTKQPIRDLEKI